MKTVLFYEKVTCMTGTADPSQQLVQLHFIVTSYGPFSPKIDLNVVNLAQYSTSGTAEYTTNYI